MLDRNAVIRIPKTELHVHLEGSIRPETLLKLSHRNQKPLPANTLEGLKDWYRFRDFNHFVQVYVAISKCIVNADDVVLIAKEFIDGQKEQGIIHSEVTYTASTLYKYAGIPLAEQMAALQEAVKYGNQVGSSVQFIVDIVRGNAEELAQITLEFALEGKEKGVVCALGLAGVEGEGTVQYKDYVREAETNGLPFIPHAGETQGPGSIKECLAIGNPPRIGHGVRCIEDADLMAELKERGTVLEVCPTSNVALGVYPSIADHPIDRLLAYGLKVTINSDDPPMFGTTLVDEVIVCSEAFGWGEETVANLQENAARASLMPKASSSWVSEGGR